MLPPTIFLPVVITTAPLWIFRQCEATRRVLDERYQSAGFTDWATAAPRLSAAFA
jgi:hypothetical protein